MKTFLALLTLCFFLTSFQHNTFTDYEYIEIVNLESKPIVIGQLNGKQAYFLLDTGSDLSFFNINDKRAFAFDVDTRGSSHIQFSGMGGKMYGVKKVEDARLQLGSQLIYSRFMSYDMQSIVYSFKRRTGIKISGIIGSDIMKNYGFKIDYEKKLVGIALKGSFYTKK